MLRPRLDEEQPGREHFRRRSPPKGASCPINNLPTEILSHIFQLGIEDGSDVYVQDLKTIRASSCDEPSRLEFGNAVHNDVTDDEINSETDEGGEGDVYFADDIEKIDQTSSKARFAHPIQFVVSHVCRHWRNAAISTASLWTSITISPVSHWHVAAFLERSKRLPIDIHVRFGSKKDGIRPRFALIPFLANINELANPYSLIVAHMHRWRSIKVTAVSSQQMNAFFHAVSGPTVTAAPQLTSLVLSIDQSTDDDDIFWFLAAGSFTLFGGSSPCLERVSLENVFINWDQDWISHASRLTTLELLHHSCLGCPSWGQFTTVLRGAPALERLVLHKSGPREDPPSLTTDPNPEIDATERNSPLQLLKLSHLSLLLQPRTCVYRLLRMLYMPALRSLTIDFLWDDYTEFLSYITAPATIPAMLSIEERPRSLVHGLETLDINCSLCPTDVIEQLYDELENVKSLKISMDDGWYEHSGCALILPLLPLTAPGHGAVNLRLRRLETLSISAASRDHLEVICQMVQQRHDAGFPIKSLYIEGKCDMAVYEEDIVWLEEKMETFVFSRQRAKQ